MRTTIDVDRSVAAAAARCLKTSSLRETVDAALREVVSAERRRSLAERIRSHTLPVPTPEVVSTQKRPRVASGSLRRHR